MTIEARNPRYIKFLIVYSGLIALLDSSLSVVEIIAIPFIIDYYGTNLSTFAYYQGLAGILSLFVFLPAWVADKFGRKFGIVVNILIMCIPALLIPIISSYSLEIFFFVYAIMILGTNANLWTLPITEESSVDKRSINTNYVYIMSLFPVILIFAVSIIYNFGWYWLYGILGLYGVILLFISYFLRETIIWENNQSSTLNNSTNIITQLKSMTNQEWKTVLVIGFAYLSWGTVFKILNTTMSIFFTDLFNYSVNTFQFIIFGSIGLSVVASLIISRFMNYSGRVLAFYFSFSGASLTFLVLALTMIPILLLIGFFFLGMCVGFLIVYIPEAFPTNLRGTSLGILLVFARTGFIIGPLIISFVMKTGVSIYNFQLLFVISSLLFVIPLFLSFIFKIQETNKISLDNVRVSKISSETEKLMITTY